MKPFIRFTQSLILFSLLALLSTQFSACRKDDFDEPPIGGSDPNLTVNMTIDSLKKLYQDSILGFNKIITIDSNWVIAGVITADDKSGNFYKTMVIEDSTAGISIRLDQSEFHTRYPIGRRVFIKLKGLVLGDYANLIQIGGYIDNTVSPAEVAPIPFALVDEYIVGGVYGLNPQPTEVTIGDLTGTSNQLKWQNRFVILKDVEFDPVDTAQTYADAVNLISVNRTINDCVGRSVLVRTSGYCNFASKKTPTGKGTLKGIFSVFVSDAQMLIRDTTDVVMDSVRCGGAAGPATIATIRSLYSGSTTSINGNFIISGVVTSDRNNGNINSQNLFIQDGTAGIQVRFASTHSFNLGDSISINVGGQSLGEFNGVLQVGRSSPSVPLAGATLLATGKTVTPMIVTIPQIIANMAGSTDSWEGMLVTIQNVTVTGGATYYTGSTSTGGNGGSCQINNGTDVMTLYTASGASFASTATPAGTVNVTAIVTEFSGTVTPPNTSAQIQIRNTTDIQ
jgi:hypothetical protein